MSRTHYQNKGFSHILLIFLIVVIGLVGFVGWKIIYGPREQSGSTARQTTKSSGITWQFDGTDWKASSIAPSCPSPLVFSNAPSDLDTATSVLYPGQVRGGNYKPHGGIAYDNSGIEITVKAIMDGKITSGARYIEMGAVQYMLWIQNDCGIAYRFDHLLTLDSAVQALFDTLPAPKPNDSRSTDFAKPLTITAGNVIASEVGIPGSRGSGYDLGVYDLRKRNAAAQDPAYIRAHQNDLSQAAYALCWFDMFSPQDSARLKSLPSRDQAQGKRSDYCK